MAEHAVTAVLAVFVCFLVLILDAKKPFKHDPVVQVSELKDFKKLLRTHNNVLVICGQSEKAVSEWKLYKAVASEMKGKATLAFINCGEDKKLCKKIKASGSDVELKHYHEGEFNKDYDRKFSIKSMVNFLRDPKGDIPWEEDAAAQDVVHIDNKMALDKLLSKEKRPILIMFYAPWCGFCKKMKPDYGAAAEDLKGQAVLAGMDVDKPENMAIRVTFNITGFPTLCYFEKGQFMYRYGGENTKDGIIKWMENPSAPKEAEQEEEWADQESDVVHLSDDAFDPFLATHGSVLVMFYAPWCGHCKQMKPEFNDAAAQLKDDEVEGVLAAVDATKEKKLGERFKVKGFPTVKYFKDGEEKWEFNERTADKIVEFLKDPQEPPPPPPPEPAWDETPSEVEHLTEDNFKSFLKRKKHALVMFYAPWCGHCKKAKPEFMTSAETFKENTKVAFAAMDCTKVASVCSEHEVTGYPSFKYFNYGKNSQKYTGGREEADFTNFMKDPMNPLAASPPPPPSPDSIWADIEGQENLNHLSDSTFDPFIKEHESVLVMFYAPWCGHCTAMKPAFAEAATKLKADGVAGALATVDVTAEKNMQSRMEIKGFPTLKYFKNGEYQFDYGRGRKTDEFIAFMKDPQEVAPPPAEPKWSDTPSNVHHLTERDFEPFLQEREHVLVMFYAPWCGHCKNAKPFYQNAADALLREGGDRFLAAVDCTDSGDVCTKAGIKGYPSIQYYSLGKLVEAYSGPRTEEGFLDYIKLASGEKKPQGEQAEGEATKTEEEENKKKKEEL